jgi:hypothetical protein
VLDGEEEEIQSSGFIFNYRSGETDYGLDPRGIYNREDL